MSAILASELDKVPSRVIKGLSWLDDSFPGWKEGISLEKLDISECKNCILGQLFGDYNEQVPKYLTPEQAIDLGFMWPNFEKNASEDSSEYSDQLTDEWKRELSA